MNKLSFEDYAAKKLDSEDFITALGLFIQAYCEDTKAHSATFNEHMSWSDDVYGEEGYFRPLTITVGKKYLRLVSYNGSQHMVYCFIDRSNGDILKAATWKAPAKGTRGNLFKVESYERARGANGGLHYGGWMYAR